MSSHTGSDVEALTLRGKQAPTALFCSNDLLATAVIADLVGLGMSVPADISVCGFDGMRFGVAHAAADHGGAAQRRHRPGGLFQPAGADPRPACAIEPPAALHRGGRHGGGGATLNARAALTPHGFFMLIAQITDLHMRTPGDKAYGIIDPCVLGPAVRALNALSPRPDCVLITGDLTDLGRPHEYAQRAQLQALEMPYFLLPGNHDDRAGLRARSPTTPTCKARVRSSSIRSTPIRCVCWRWTPWCR